MYFSVVFITMYMCVYFIVVLSRCICVYFIVVLIMFIVTDSDIMIEMITHGLVIAEKLWKGQNL